MPLPFNGLYRFDEFELDPSRRSLSRNSVIVPLSSKAFEIFTYLVANPGRVVTKDELLKAVWPESFVEESNLPGYISGLRKALADRAGYIATIPGQGYQFTARVQTETHANSSPKQGPEDIPTHQIQRMRESTHVIIRETSSPVRALAESRSLLRHWSPWVLIAVAMASGAATYYGFYIRSQPQQLSKVMVADFLNLTGDPSFDHTLKSALEIGLAQSPYIQLMGEGDEHSALSMMQKAPDSPLLGEIALEVCKRNNYQALLRGQIASGSKWGSDTISIELVNCATSRTIAVLHGDAFNKDAVLSTLDGLTVGARRKLGESNYSIEQFDVPIMNESTFSFDALQAFNTGSNLGSDGKILECIPYFQRAVDLDPKFAMAQASLGTAYLTLGDTKKAAAYSKVAFNLSGDISQWEKLYIRYNYYLMTLHDLDSALSTVDEWTRVYPRDETSWQALTYVEIQVGNYPVASQAAQYALQMSPIKYAIEYQNLADASMREGHFADAKRTIAQAQAQGKDGPALHQLLLQIAFLEHDPKALQSEIEWASGHPELWLSLEIQAILAADLGKEQESESLFHSTMLDAIKEGQPALTDSMMLDEAGVEVDLGQMTKATQLLAQVKDHGSITWALLATKAGSTTAEATYFKAPNAYPNDTLATKVLIPELKALLALRRNNPTAAIQLLEPGRPYELVLPEVIDLRGQAYLVAKQGAKAQDEFQKLIDHPAVEEPTMPRTILAHLGLARAYAMQGDMEDSRKEYETFFNLWIDADTDLPVLKQAHLEFARLN
ncbi:MAG TPA: winged helix-turn-helix domain-containing protein [Acidobacteriaceae bacterium]|jgi:DNA-binding winged helix-turn-helix (wHTH) protein/tetratricopeptide (TPR) repeat protein|nr:winged helix-turn-helix domain-containing protein [Acidobacteriaceae bacterium]